MTQSRKDAKERKERHQIFSFFAFPCVSLHHGALASSPYFQSMCSRQNRSGVLGELLPLLGVDACDDLDSLLDRLGLQCREGESEERSVLL